MAFTPQTEVRLLAGVPLSVENKNQLFWNSIDSQTNYFYGKTHRVASDFTYQRKTQAIAFPEHADALQTVTYLMYRNENYTGKWFYGFVTSIEYVNPNTSLVTFEEDAYQTWFFELEYRPSFIERQHCDRWNPDGTPVINTVPEDLMTGFEYETVGEDTPEWPTKNYYLMAATTDFKKVMENYPNMPDKMPMPRPQVVNGLQSGLDYYIFTDDTAEGTGEFGEFIGGGGGSYSLDTVSNLAAAVLGYEAYVTTACNNNGISEYKNVILAIMDEESGGVGGDVMQCSESQGWAPNTITDPYQSIDIGVAYFAENLRLAKTYGFDMWAAVQAYNYGGGYLSWMNWNKVVSGFETAKMYAQMQSNGVTGSYVNEISTALGYNWIYMYGNMFYAELVRRRHFTMTQKLPVNEPYTVTSEFGWRTSPFTGASEFHNGIDLNGSTDDPVYATEAGTVVYAQMTESYGNFCVVKTVSGKYCGYAHLNRFGQPVGMNVIPGDIVGRIGSTGDSTGPHLHFNVDTGLFAHNYQNPREYLGI